MIEKNRNIKQQARLNKAKRTLSSVPEANELLKLAKNSGCNIIFDKKLKENQHGWIDFRNRAIKLNPNLKDKDLLCALAHELRHLWQATIIDFSTIYDTSFLGNGAFIFMRVTEGDANAFSEKIMHKLRSNTNEINMNKIFIDFQKTTSAQGYDLQTTNYLLQINQHLAQRKFSLKQIRSIFNLSSSPQKNSGGLLQITLDGIDSNSRNYMGYKNLEELSQSIIAHIPKDTLDESLYLIKSIKRKTKKALKIMA